MRGLVFDVSGLLKRPGSVETVMITDKLPPAEKGHEKIEVVGPVHATVRLKEAGGRILAEGVLNADVILTCGRCLERYDQQVEQTFNEIYRRHEDFNKQDPEEREEENLFAIDNLKIDLTPMLSQALVLAVPFKPVCREDCLGLCPVCGEELNSGVHEHCETDEEESEFKAALRKYAEEHSDDDNKKQ